MRDDQIPQNWSNVVQDSSDIPTYVNVSFASTWTLPSEIDVDTVQSASVISSGIRSSNEEAIPGDPDTGSSSDGDLVLPNEGDVLSSNSFPNERDDSLPITDPINIHMPQMMNLETSGYRISTRSTKGKKPCI